MSTRPSNSSSRPVTRPAWRRWRHDRRGDAPAREGDWRDLGDRRADGARSVSGPLRDGPGHYHVRVRRLRAAGAVLALDAWPGLPADQDAVRLRAEQDLRARYQHEP